MGAVYRSLVIGLLIATLPQVAAAVPDTKSPAELPQREREALVTSACAGLGVRGDPVAWREPGANRKLRSRIDCLTGRQVEGREIVRHFTCERTAPRQWRCDGGADFLVMALSARSVLVGPGEPAGEARTVLQIADFVGNRYGTTFNGRDLSAMMRDRCEVRRLGPAVFRGGVEYLLSCGSRGVVVTQDCGARPCRLFPSELRDADPPVSALVSTDTR